MKDFGIISRVNRFSQLFKVLLFKVLLVTHAMAYCNGAFCLWTQQQAQLLRQGAWSGLDLENLIEEITSMGKREQRALGSYLRNVVMHLLKWQYQPQRSSTPVLNSNEFEKYLLMPQ